MKRQESYSCKSWLLQWSSGFVEDDERVILPMVWRLQVDESNGILLLLLPLAELLPSEVESSLDLLLLTSIIIITSWLIGHPKLVVTSSLVASEQADERKRFVDDESHHFPPHTPPSNSSAMVVKLKLSLAFFFFFFFLNVMFSFLAKYLIHLNTNTREFYFMACHDVYWYI